MNSKIEALYKSSFQALEVFAFMMVDKADPKTIGELPVRAKINFSGALSGVIEVCTTDELIKNACDTLLGEDEGRSDSDKMSFLMEIANITAGNFVTHYGGTHMKVDLGIPAKSTEINKFEDQVAHVDVETDCVIMFQIRIDDA